MIRIIIIWWLLLGSGAMAAPPSASQKNWNAVNLAPLDAIKWRSLLPSWVGGWRVGGVGGLSTCPLQLSRIHNERSGHPPTHPPTTWLWLRLIQSESPGACTPSADPSPSHPASHPPPTSFPLTWVRRTPPSIQTPPVLYSLLLSPFPPSSPPHSVDFIPIFLLFQFRYSVSNDPNTRRNAHLRFIFIDWIHLSDWPSPHWSGVIQFLALG